MIFGLSATSFALADLVVGNIERIRLYVRHGTLDAILVRPLSVLGQLLSLDFTIRRVARLAVAVAVLAVAVWRADVVFSPARVALLVVAPLPGRCSSPPCSWPRPRWRSGGSTRASSPTRSPTAGGTSRRTR